MVKRNVLWVFITFLSIALLSACSVVNDLSAITDASNAFMTALRDGDHSASWNMLTEDIQSEIGSETAWNEFAAIRNFSEWKFTETNFENDLGQSIGEATLGTETYTVELVLSKVGEEWKIAGINFTFKE